MPSNKQRDLQKKAAAAQKLLEQTGSGEVVYESVAIMPVLEKNVVIYQIVRIGFTAAREMTILEEIDRCKTQGTALAKLQTAASKSIFNLQVLRSVTKSLKQEA